MTSPEILVLAGVFAAIAVLYSSVGHGGASGYLAVMALAGFVPAEVMKPTALALNVLVASLATARFARVGGFPWHLWWPFVVTSIPCAFIGGAIELDPTWYKRGLGLVLFIAALRLLIAPRDSGHQRSRSLPLVAALACGAGIGFASGLIGVGGGIFLSPLVLLAGWATVRQTAVISAAFILVNSVAGLAGHLAAAQQLPAAVPIWGVAVLVGGFVGSGLGSRRFGTLVFRRALAVVLLIASVKMYLAVAPTPNQNQPDPDQPASLEDQP